MKKKYIVVEQDAYDFMIVGASLQEICNYKNHVEQSTYSGIIDIKHFSIPKEGLVSSVSVYVTGCTNSASGRQMIIGYWVHNGFELIHT